MDLKSLLNKEQCEAAITVDGPLLILAGAGSGKTRVLTYRIAHMIQDLNIYPSQILSITFTNKAAGEMKDRVRSLVGNIADNMWISTFHSSCVRILRREIDKIGYNKNFTIYDSYDQKSLIKQCMKEIDINDKDLTDSEILNKISSAKNELISAAKFKKENEGDFRKNKVADVYLLYQKKLKGNNALDFDDLIFKAVELLKNNKDVLDFYHSKFKYIMVDEYQDTNKAQYELIKLLVDKTENICVVGDDDQCIYAWRGADVTNILDFEKDYPKAKVVKLEQNYRSKGNILMAANEVIKNNSQRKDKALRTEKENGEKINLYRAFTDRDEANFVSNQIKTIMAEGNRSYKDFAILYRMNSQSRIFEESFRKHLIPYKIVGGLKFYDRKEIKDIMAYLKLINNPLDDIALKRIINVPKRNIGDATIQKIQEFANGIEQCLYSAILDVEYIPTLTTRNKSSISKFVSLMNNFMAKNEEVSVSKLIKTIIEDTGYLKQLENSKEPDDESRVENIKELVSDAVEFERTSEDKSLLTFLEGVSLGSTTDDPNETIDTAAMMTVHSAKGLEFPVVFMVGMENGIFPGMSSINNPSEMEESRRLCYVAITRAEEKLYITSAESRMVFGRNVSYQPSDFISEISPDLKEIIGGAKNRTTQVLKRKNAKESQRYNPHGLLSKTAPQDYVSATAHGDNSGQQGINSENVINNGLNNISSEATVGRKVRHTKFGIGTIVSRSSSDGDTLISIAFDNMGIKKLMLGKAPLEML
ncbi:DNA helicase PcrA [Clostridium estertheticum]|uniref:DNA helicase PcrA n=1 Tax=Clostridium estertheticum TaxID=238834 RepID=UPI001C7CCCD2|nr:DNA helicase PcrA [Clostridium estertheticum]MBX4263501.1 DNA helicase PcrA [Clostridium estertheticum]WLC87334.1 DNA helicase PcrA [Clostridium estertheticum]